MTLLKRLVSSFGEARLYELAKSIFGSTAAERIFLKVRLADVIDFDSPIWTSRERSFSLASHFDLIVCDENLEPTMALEFDGLQHSLDVQAQRDTLKDVICQKADLPILRVRWDDLRRPIELAQRLRELVQPSSVERILCLEIAVKLAGRILKSRPSAGIQQTPEDVIRLAEGILATRYLRLAAEDVQSWYTNYSPNLPSDAFLPDGCRSKWRFLILSAVTSVFLVHDSGEVFCGTADMNALALEMVHAAMTLDRTLRAKGMGHSS